MIVTSMRLTISSRRDIAVLQKESSTLEGEEDVNETCRAEGKAAAQVLRAYMRDYVARNRAASQQELDLFEKARVG